MVDHRGTLLPLLAAVSDAGGVARAASLARAGHSRYRVGVALREEHLIRVRRDWVALPGADPELVAAAREAVVLSCITLARRLGLWVLDEDRCHVAADPRGAGGKSRLARVHWAVPLVPRHPDALVDTIENALVLVATCRPFETALAVCESAIHTGRATREMLARMDVPPAARAVLAATDPFADSGLETLFRTRLRWLRLRIAWQIWIAGHRVDFLIGDRLAVQLDGGHHVGAQRASDVAHDAQLMLLGYHVLRFTYAQIVADWAAVQDTIMRAVAVGLHRAA